MTAEKVNNIIDGEIAKIKDEISLVEKDIKRAMLYLIHGAKTARSAQILDDYNKGVLSSHLKQLDRQVVLLETLKAIIKKEEKAEEEKRKQQMNSTVDAILYNFMRGSLK